MVYSRAGPNSNSGTIKGVTKNYKTDFLNGIELKIPNSPDGYAGLFGDPYLEIACSIVHTCASSGYIDEISMLLDEHMRERGYKECSLPLIRAIVETATRERPMYCDNKLRDIRAGRGIKQKELSNLTGISPTRISEYENNDVYPSAENCKKIAEALGVDESDIWQI